MQKSSRVDKPIEQPLRQKRLELIFALSAPEQGYTPSQVGRIFGMHRSSILRILKDRPRDYKPKWVKAQ